MSWDANQDYGGMEQQIPFSNFTNSSQEFVQPQNFQAYILQYQWCNHCGGDHFEEDCYSFNSTHQIPQNFFPQYTNNYPIPYQDLSDYQYQEPQYQNFSQDCQPFNPIQNQAPPPSTLQAKIDELLRSQQQRDEEIRHDREKLRQEAERLEQLSAHYKMLEEHKVINERRDEEDNDLKDEEPEVHHVIEGPNIRKDYMPEAQVEFQEDKDNEPCQSHLLEEQKDQNFAKTAAWPGIEETKEIGEDIENQEQLENSYMEKEDTNNDYHGEEEMEDMHQKESSEEEESIFLDIEPQRLPEWNVQQMSLNEFLDARHLRIYLESKVDGERGLVSTQTCEDCDSRG